MSTDWSPDESPENEAYEAWDEALDEEDDVEPDAIGGPQGERSLDRQLTVDEEELFEIGAALDNPENLAVLDGCTDDPDGIGPDGSTGPTEDEGWDLDAAEAQTGRHLDDDDG
jgi:hypothetical protein